MKNYKICYFLAALFLFTACGPKRYGCGPNRRCDVTKTFIPIIKSDILC